MNKIVLSVNTYKCIFKNMYIYKYNDDGKHVAVIKKEKHLVKMLQTALIKGKY